LTSAHVVKITAIKYGCNRTKSGNALNKGIAIIGEEPEMNG
jgi:hypothetical protein